MLDQIDLIDIFREFYTKAVEYTFLSIAYGTFSKINHTIGHKTSLNTFKTKIASSMISNKNSVKLKINYMKKHKIMNNMLLNNEWVNNEIK